MCTQSKLLSSEWHLWMTTRWVGGLGGLLWMHWLWNEWGATPCLKNRMHAGITNHCLIPSIQPKTSIRPILMVRWLLKVLMLMVILKVMFCRMCLDPNTHRHTNKCIFTDWLINIFGSRLQNTTPQSWNTCQMCCYCRYVSQNITLRKLIMKWLNCLQKYTKCPKLMPEYALISSAFPVFSTSKPQMFSQMYHSILLLTAWTSINLPWVPLLLDPMEILRLCPNWLRHSPLALFPSRPWSSCGTAQLSASPAHSGQVTGILALASKLGHLKSQEDWMSQRRSTLSRTLAPLPFRCSLI